MKCRGSKKGVGKREMVMMLYVLLCLEASYFCMTRMRFLHLAQEIKQIHNHKNNKNHHQTNEHLHKKKKKKKERKRKSHHHTTTSPLFLHKEKAKQLVCDVNLRHHETKETCAVKHQQYISMTQEKCQTKKEQRRKDEENKRKKRRKKRCT